MMKAMKFIWAFGLLGAATFCGCSETQSSISPPPQQNVATFGKLKLMHTVWCRNLRQRLCGPVRRR